MKPKSPTPSVRPERSRGAPQRAARPREGDRPLYLSFGPAGLVSRDQEELDATAEWLKHVEAGRIG